MPSTTPQGRPPSPQADQSLRGLGLCLTLRGSRSQLSGPSDPPETLGLEFPGQTSHPLSTSFQLFWQMRRLHRLQKEGCGRDSFERDQELKEGRISPLQSKPQAPLACTSRTSKWFRHPFNGMLARVSPSEFSRITQFIILIFSLFLHI